MAQLVLSVAGAAVGFAIGGPTGAQIGWVVGSVLGGALNTQRLQGPRLQDLRVTAADYGQPIPWLAGSPRVAGQIWWASSKREIATTRRQGKGGGAKYTEYSYEIDLLIGLGEGYSGTVPDVARVWSNGQLVYSSRVDSGGDTVAASVNTDLWRRMTFYGGAVTQLPDPTYEAAVGAANAPAYRGRAYVFIEGLQLGNSGQLPNLTFELATAQGSPDDSVVACYDFTRESFADLSCTAIGDFVPYASNVTGGINRNTFNVGGAYLASDGWHFEQDAVASSLETKGGYIFDATDMPFAVGQARTYEVLFSIEQVLGQRTDATRGVQVAFICDGIYSETKHFVLSVRPLAGQVSVGIPFTSSTWVSVAGVGEGGLIHYAVVFPSGTISASNPVRCYVNGVQVKTHDQRSLAVSDDATWFLGGRQDISPALTTYAMRYVGARVTNANLYPGGTSFDPPARFQSPVCIPPTVAGCAPLRQVVEALCDRAGMPAGTYDASDLTSATRDVCALAVAQVTSARAVLEQLAAAYFLTARLSDKLYIARRQNASVSSIDHADLGAAADRSADEPFVPRVADDLEVPAQVAVRYANRADDSQPGTEYSDRLISGQASTEVVELALGMLPAHAKLVADALVTDRAASRVTASIATSLRHAHLEPGDVITVQDASGRDWRMRIERRTDAGGVLGFDLVSDDDGALSSAQTTDDGDVSTLYLQGPAETVYRALDIPLLRDADDAPGWYVAARGRTENWPGAQILASADGSNFVAVAEVLEPAVIGQARTALPTWTRGHVMDRINSVRVYVSHGELESTTLSALLANAEVNAMLLGSEVVRFQIATPLGNGEYTLSNLLRGQRGTEWAVGTHVVGERVVLLRAAGLRRVTTQVADIGQVRYIRGVTRGQAVDSVSSTTFTDTGVALKPLAPVDLRVEAISGGVVLTWKRRTRLSTRFTGTGGIAAPLGEASELYVVNVYDPGDSLVQTQTVTTAQCTIMIDPIAGYSATVQQVSALVGAGYAASIDF